MKKRRVNGPDDPLTHEDDPILNLSEVGRMIGKSPQTIGRWCQDGLLRCLPLPNGLRGVRKSEINKFLGGSALDVTIH